MRALLLLLAVLSVLAAGCSGTDDAATDGSTDAATDAAAADVATDSPTDAAADGATGGTGTIDAAACQEAAEALSAIPAALPEILSGNADTQALAAQAETLANLEVPAEIQDDFQVLADAYTQVAETLSGITLEPGQAPDAETQAALTELQTTLSTPEITTASTNLATFFANGCQ